MDLLTDFLQPGKVIFRKKIYDPETVLSGIESVARYLKDHLVSDSPFIYLFASNHIKTVFSYFGIIKARRICVIMDPQIGPIELKEMLLDTPPAACIRIDATSETFDFNKEIELRKQPWKDDPHQDLSDVCTMIYTAAEDGYAKAAMLTHENMLSNARAVVEGNIVTADSVTCALLPFSHLYGLQVMLITPFLSGGATIINEESAIIKLTGVLDYFNDFRITHFYSIPVVYYLLSKAKNVHKKLDCVKNAISGGYKLSNLIQAKIINTYPCRVREGYGLAEASPVCTLNSPQEEMKVGSIGHALSCCTIKIVSENNNETRIDQIGEIVIKGKNIMKGYYNHLNATKKILNDGWLHSGDLGYKDKDGFIYFSGLKKRMINYGGNKVYPAEVERLMRMNGSIVDIEVIGEDDQLFGQKVQAKIKLKENTPFMQNELIAWCHQHISHYKIFSKADFS